MSKYPTLSDKHYQCDRCGCIKTQRTNHYGPTWSSGMSNMCPACPPFAKMAIFGGQTHWACLDKQPARQAEKVEP